MAKFHSLLLRAIRITAWPLLALMLVFIASGYALSGQYGFGRVLEAETALKLHRLFDIPLVVLFVVHSAGGAYFALRRWGWIGKRKTP